MKRQSNMKWEEYFDKFDKILEGDITGSPYDNETYLEYVKLNRSRVKRWLKRFELKQEIIDTIKNIREPQKWILIAEPWCGDAANIAPVINHMSTVSDNIDLEIHLRDDSNLIDSYLTNGGKAIPKLIARDLKGNDLFTWGPRPVACQEMVMKNKTSGMSTKEKKSAIQVWYNEDQGITLQREFTSILSQFNQKDVA